MIEPYKHFDAAAASAAEFAQAMAETRVNRPKIGEALTKWAGADDAADVDNHPNYELSYHRMPFDQRIAACNRVTALPLPHPTRPDVVASAACCFAYGLPELRDGEPPYHAWAIVIIQFPRPADAEPADMNARLQTMAESVKSQHLAEIDPPRP